MIKNKNIFLMELANEPDLHDNTISLVFASNPNIDISKREKFVEYISPFYKRLKEKERKPFEIKDSDQTEIIEKFENKDFRIKNVKLSSIRGYPKSDKPFGVDFCNKQGNPESIVILGTNGSGKSSLYEAIEYTFCRRVGETELRTFDPIKDNDPQFEKYLSHFDNGFSDCKCQIEVNQKDFDSFNIHTENIPTIVRQKVNPDTHFISDFDIYYTGKLDYESGKDRSFHYTIAKSLGLTELLEFEKNIKAFIYYKRQTESRKINAFERENESSRKTIEASKKALEENEMLVKSLKGKQKITPDDKRIKEALEVLNQLKQTYLTFNFNYNDLQITIQEYQKSYSEFIALNIKGGDYEVQQFLGMGLELLKEAENCPFCENSVDNKDTIAHNVSDRLKRIESLNTATQKLNSTFNQLFEQLNTLFNQINLGRSSIHKETNLLVEKVDFIDLLETENKFLSYASEFVGSDFFIEGQNLEENTNFIKNKFQFLFEYVKSNAEIIESGFLKFVENIPALIEKRESIISKIEQNISIKTQGQTLTEQSFGLKKDIDDLKLRIENSQKTIDRNNKEIDILRQEILLFDNIKKETIKFQEFYHNKLNKEVDKAFAPIKLIVEEILEYYFTQIDERNIDIEISKKPDIVDEETGEVLSEIITAFAVPKDKSIKPLSIKKYLNTFHYRLFSTMVGISIAIASRINTRINLPLVLDDIFYASDFENRTTIQKFIKNLFEAFEKYTPDIPVQIIMFTHDELIFEGTINAVFENQDENISFAKLFPYNDSKDEGEYLNLIYKIPAYLPQKLYEKTI